MPFEYAILYAPDIIALYVVYPSRKKSCLTNKKKNAGELFDFRGRLVVAVCTKMNIFMPYPEGIV